MTVAGERARRFDGPEDPLWDRQWYLHGTRENDINVAGAWAKGYTGRGVVVTVVDDGIEHTHPDLEANYDPSASTDINGGDDDPFPNEADPINKHGTRCCGEIASLKNDICGVGIAFNCKIGAVRMLDGDVTDSVEAHSLSLAPQHIDIYSNSWGPNDDGRTIEGPAALAQRAIEDGIATGRGGKGSIYVFASGNGGSSGDSCNCDGYCNSIYTIAIGAITEDNTKPYYTEPCTATLAATYSSGSGRQRSITTVDLHNGCTSQHSGTSAAAPLAAGIFALVLEANAALTWRDVQHLVVQTSRKINSDDSSWKANGVGRRFSPKYGYGSLDATALVTAAETWDLVAPVIVTRIEGKPEDMTTGPITGTIDVAETATFIRKLEHVQVTVDIETSRRGNVAVHITSPSGTRSELMPFRSKDASSTELRWTYMTVESWGESPVGTFTVEVETRVNARATLRSWSITLHGTAAGAVAQTQTGVPSVAPSAAPTTAAPSRRPTDAPATATPSTHSPTTTAPTTKAPTTVAPTTMAPSLTADTVIDTYAPATAAPVTAAPTTTAPTTASPSTAAPVRAAVVVDCNTDVCSAGTYQLRLNEAGDCSSDPASCKPCPVGHACTGATALATPCPLGFFGGTSPLACSKCHLGFYSDTLASTTCKVIEAGHYGIGGAVDARQGVRLCPVGHYCLGGGNDVLPCHANTSQGQAGQSSCVPCGEGLHQPTEGRPRCITVTESVSAVETPAASNSQSILMVGAVVGSIAGLSIVGVIFMVVRSCRDGSGGAYAIATAPDRFSIDDHESDEDEIHDSYSPKFVHDPDNGEAACAVMSGMKNALDNEESDDGWELPAAQ
jgi:subtilisin-like proprotein convertase family protein